MSLTTQDKILIEQRITNDAKSAGVAYALWFFVGFLGAHRFYLGRTGSAIAQLALTLIGGLTLAVMVGIAFILIVAVWLIVDAFLIPGMIREDKEQLRNKLLNDAHMAPGQA